MNDLLSQIKNALKELLLVFLIISIIIAFVAPVVTLWGGLYNASVQTSLTAVSLKTFLTRGRMETTGSFDWTLEEEEVKTNAS